MKRDLSFNYIKDFSDLLIIHVSKENFCILKGRYTLGSYKPYCMALYIQSINISVTIKLRNTKTSYHFFVSNGRRLYNYHNELMHKLSITSFNPGTSVFQGFIAFY